MPRAPSSSSVCCTASSVSARNSTNTCSTLSSVRARSASDANCESQSASIQLQTYQNTHTHKHTHASCHRRLQRFRLTIRRETRNCINPSTSTNSQKGNHREPRTFSSFMLLRFDCGSRLPAHLKEAVLSASFSHSFIQGGIPSGPRFFPLERGTSGPICDG